MNAEEQNELRKELLKDQEHEFKMYNDLDYFCEYTTENYSKYCKDKSYIWLIDIIQDLHKICDKYNQSFNKLCDYIKEI